MSEHSLKKHFAIGFTPESEAALKKMSSEEGVSAAELVRRAINFYQVRIEAKNEHKRIILERDDGVQEWIPL